MTDAARRGASRDDDHMKEIAALRERISDAEEKLRALIASRPDAAVRPGPATESVHTPGDTAHPYRMMIETMADGVGMLTGGGVILYCNRRFADMVGMQLENVIGAQIQKFLVADQIPEFGRLLRRACGGGAAKSLIGIACRDGTAIPVQIALCRLRSEGPQAIVAVVTDLAEIVGLQRRTIRLNRDLERKMRVNEKALGRTTMALRMLRASARIRSEVREEAQLLTEMCKAAVEIGGFELVWVGYPENETSKSVRPMAAFGVDARMIANAGIPRAETNGFRDPITAAMRSGTTVIVRAPKSNVDRGSCQVIGTTFGCRSLAVVPLRVEDRVFGAMSFHSKAPDTFDLDEVSLLDEFVGDVASAIAVIRSRAAPADAFSAVRRSR